jgi:hypothetical protein
MKFAAQSSEALETIFSQSKTERSNWRTGEKKKTKGSESGELRARTTAPSQKSCVFGAFCGPVSQFAFASSFFQKAETTGGKA